MKVWIAGLALSLLGGCRCQNGRERQPEATPPARRTVPVSQAIAIAQITDASEPNLLAVAKALGANGTLTSTVPIDPTYCERVTAWQVTGANSASVELVERFKQSDCADPLASWRLSYLASSETIPEPDHQERPAFAREHVERHYRWSALGWLQTLQSEAYSHGTSATSPKLDRIDADLPSGTQRSSDSVHATRRTWMLGPWQSHRTRLMARVVEDRCEHGDSVVYLLLTAHDDTTAFLPAKVSASIEATLASLGARVITTPPPPPTALRCAPSPTQEP